MKIICCRFISDVSCIALYLFLLTFTIHMNSLLRQRFNLVSFRWRFLPSFLRLLVIGDQSNQTHRALLWWPRTRGSLRLEETANTAWMTNNSSHICLHLQPQDNSSQENCGDEPMHQNANGDENLYCFVLIMHTAQGCEMRFLPMKLHAALLIAG